MNIKVQFSQWNTLDRDINQRPQFSWEQSFNNKLQIGDIFELAFGYTYALILLHPTNTSITVTLDDTRYKHRDFFRLPRSRDYFLSITSHTPRIDDTIHTYLRRIRAKTPTMDYITVISPHGRKDKQIHVLQFNSLSFLQGFLSIFNGFRVGTINYIITIYNKNGIEYTVK
ncbi:Hypothetical protein HVR_LOCUS46 [uncultured virus]|nr:Hypothetical protein HVR_LOCUS46 [uncultured virus]